MFNVLFSSLKSFADIAAPAAAQATAQTTEATTAVAPSAPAWMQFVPFIVILGVMYFIVIRPQAKKQKETQDFLGALRVGDQVVTQAGILGRVTALTDSIVTLEVANQTQMKFLKSSILMSQIALQAANKKEGN